MYAFDRTENGNTVRVSSAVALEEINHAMMGGRRKVRTMSSGGDRHAIEYTDGRSVKLVRIKVEDQPAAVNVIGVNGGEVHTMSAFTTPGKVYAQCRVSARTNYRETSAPITCDVCRENERRTQH